MRAFLALTTLSLLIAPSCEKAKDLVRSARDVAPSRAAAAAASIEEIDAASYESFTATPGRLSVVEFGADWCGACKAMEPVVAQVAGEFAAQAVVGKIDIDRAKAFTKAENVSSIPELRFYREGKEVERIVGGVDAETLRQIFQKHTAGLEKGPAAGPAGTEAPPQAPVSPITPMKKDWLPPGIEKR